MKRIIVPCSLFLVPCLQIRVSGFGFLVSGFWFLVSNLWFRVSGFGVRVSGFWFLVSGFWFLVVWHIQYRTRFNALTPHTPIPPYPHTPIPPYPSLPLRHPGTPALQHSSIPALLLSVFFLIHLAPTASAQSVRAYLSEDSVRVGDRFELTLVAEHVHPEAPIFPPVAAGGEFFGDLEVIDIHSQGSLTAEAGGMKIDSLIYEVTTFALDTAYVPSIPVFFLAGADTTFLASYPLELPIISLVPTDAEDIRDLAPLAEFPINPWPWIVGFLLLALLGGGLYRYLKQKPSSTASVVLPTPKRRIPPYEEALSRLQALEKTSNLKDVMQIKPYYVELTETLRVYLARRLRIHAMENTSHELMKDMNRLALENKIPAEAVYLTKRVLHVSDLVKFADMQPPPEVGGQAMVETRKALDSIEEALKPAPPPPVASPPETAEAVQNDNE